MNKILNRKMFRQKYLGVQKPQGFQTGGVAEAAKLDISDEELEKELNIEKTEPKAEPEVESLAKTEDTGFASGIAKILSLEDTSSGLTRNQKLQSYLAPIAAALLTGDQRAGESKVSGTLRALGLGISTLPGTIQAINKSDLEARAKKDERDAAIVEGYTKEVSIAEARRLGVNLEGVVSPGDIGTIQITYDPVTKTNSVSGKSNLSIKGADEVNRLRGLIDADDRQFISEYNSLVMELEKAIMNNPVYNDEGVLVDFDIPGQGVIQTKAFGKDARAIERKIRILIDSISRQRSGASLTEQEVKNFDQILGTTGLAGDGDLIKALYDIGQVANRKLNSTKAGFSPEVIESFFGGNQFATPNSKVLEKYMSAGEKDMKTYSPDDLDKIAGGD